MGWERRKRRLMKGGSDLHCSEEGGEDDGIKNKSLMRGGEGPVLSALEVISMMRKRRDSMKGERASRVLL
jgi:hypothetical protein